MQLFQKIDNILKYYNFSRIMLAKKINIHVATFNRYFTPDQEDKLRSCLWDIHKIFPEISRDWLFFDEGEMFLTSNNNSFLSDKELEKKNIELQNELFEERKLNRKLQSELIEERKISRELQAKLDYATLQDKAVFQKIAN